MANKTVRRVEPKKVGGFERHAETPRFIVLNRGQNCYVLTATGKTIQTKVGSEVFIAETALLHTANAVKVEAELAANEDKFPGLGWGAALAALTAPAEEAADETAAA